MNEVTATQPMDSFIQGQKDCRDGKPHKAGKPEAYDEGFRFQYELEQIMGAQYAG